MVDYRIRARIVWGACGIALIVGLAMIITNSGGHSHALTKPGFLDDAELTPQDQHRLVELAALALDDQLTAIRSRSRSLVTARDFELLRQDRRRARAAYPDVPRDKLFRGGWLMIDLKERVPSIWGSLNSSGTKRDGEWYLDGPDHESFVDSAYLKRATAAETKNTSRR